VRALLNPGGDPADRPWLADNPSAGRGRPGPLGGNIVFATFALALVLTARRRTRSPTEEPFVGDTLRQET
jgi:hypothetical protein